MVAAPASYNFADVWEMAADALGDKEALVIGDERRTYAQLEDRANRLANHLLGVGVGARRPRGPLPRELPRVPRGDDRLLQDPGRPDQHQPPLRGRRARVPARRQRLGRRPARTAAPRRDRRGAARTCPTSAGRSSPAPTTTPPRRPRRPTVRRAAIAATTTTTSCTPAAPPACPRASCGARATRSSRASAAATRCGCRARCRRRRSCPIGSASTSPTCRWPR